MACDPKLVGIQLFYCKGNRVETKWVDLDEVEALAWCTGTIGEKDDGKSGNTPFPTRPGIAPCPGTADVAGIAGNPSDPICWWDGVKWVCGTL